MAVMVLSLVYTNEGREEGDVKSWLVNLRSLPKAELLANNDFSVLLVLSL
jgi:hypothetical protein